MRAMNMKKYRHILCTTDFSKSSKHALQEAKFLEDITKAKLTLAHFVEPIIPNIYYDIPPTDETDGLIKNAKKRMEALRQDHQLSNANIIVDSGSAKMSIVKLAEKLKIDLIIIGKHGHHDFIERFLGSTSNYVVNHAACDVLIVQK